MTRAFLIVLLCSLCLLGPPPARGESRAADLPAFATQLDEIREILRIPGLSAAVVSDGQLLWADGFGYADLARDIPATAHTPYGLASVTKPIAATLIMQLVAEGAIDLEAPVAAYGIQLPNAATVTVRHLLTHTSEGQPGTTFAYNGNRYALLGGVIEGATGRSFAVELSDRVLLPLALTDTAVNPLSQWNGRQSLDAEDVQRLLGWGGRFAAFPDVYRRLATPYQLDEEFETVPGMYHLVHSPAAGLVSSAADLAAFDIALDAGELLPAATRDLMVSPAVPTVTDRAGLAYGLGWYVQSFADETLLWHTGRWPPSTSALYLKVPGERLTFIALANTDNLTVPFVGLGHGDVSKSVLTLAFWRHFVYPRQYGTALPVIDWSADEGALVNALRQIDDPAAAEFLERELWAYRQAYAAGGDEASADKLERVDRRAYPSSTFRRDAWFTATAGPSPALPAIARAADLVWPARLMVIWLALTGVCVLWLGAWLYRDRARPGQPWWVWLGAGVVLGPVALLVYRWAGRGAAPRAGTVVTAAACCSTSAYALAWVGVIALLRRTAEGVHPLAIIGIALGLPLLMGWLMVRVPLLVRTGQMSVEAAISRGWVAELMGVCLAFAVLFPATLWLQDRVLGTLPGAGTPFLWAFVSFAALMALPLQWMLHAILQRRGYEVWHLPAAARGAAGVALPAPRETWWLLLLSVGITIASLVGSIVVFG